jgi:hypothetical protein
MPLAVICPPFALMAVCAVRFEPGVIAQDPLVCVTPPPDMAQL